MTLLFVYNANSGKLNALLHAGHKLLSPSTYQCRLCALTFDNFTENKIWKNFRNESHVEMKFFHKDEFEMQFPNVKIEYPTVLKLEDHQLSTFITNDVLNSISNVKDLIGKIKSIM